MPKYQEADTWVGNALVKPENNSEQARSGFLGAYGLVACYARTLPQAVASLSNELSDNAVILDGFEWLLRRSDIDRDLTEKEQTLVARLDVYSVQFHTFHWFRENREDSAAHPI